MQKNNAKSGVGQAEGGQGASENHHDTLGEDEVDLKNVNWDNARANKDYPKFTKKHPETTSTAAKLKTDNAKHMFQNYYVAAKLI